MTKTKSRQIGVLLVLLAGIIAYVVFRRPGINLPWRVAVSYGILIAYVITTAFFFIAPFRTR